MVDLRPHPHAAHGLILSIETPEQPSLRARKVVTRSRARSTGKFPSWKMGRMVQWESPNELNAYRLLDANPSVKKFYEQPLVILYELDGEAHRHIPDALVEGLLHRELWEIKPANEAAKPEVAKRSQLMTECLPDFGFSYRVVLAEDLAREPRLSNALRLLKYGRQPIQLHEYEQLRLILLATGGISWDFVLSGPLGGRSRNVIARLALQGLVTIDLDSDFGPKNLFRWAAPVQEGG